VWSGNKEALYYARLPQGAVYFTGEKVVFQVVEKVSGEKVLSEQVLPPDKSSASSPEAMSADQVITVKNDGDVDLNIGQVTTPGAPFSIVADNVSNQTLAPGASATLTVRFAPPAAGPYNDSFDIPSNDPDENPVTVNLSGNGVIAPDLTGRFTMLMTGNFTMLRSSAGDSTVMARVLIQNTGNAASGSFKITFYLSADASFDPGADQFLRSGNIPGIGAGKDTTTSFLYKFRHSVSGKYLLCVIDSANRVAESNENNNVASGQIP